MALQRIINGQRVDLAPNEVREHRLALEQHARLAPGAAEEEIIRAAIYNVDFDELTWRTRSASRLASELNAKKILRPMRPGDLWRATLQLAEDAYQDQIADEIAESRKYSAASQQLAEALNRGDLVEVQIQLRTLPGLTSLAREHALDAIDAHALSVLELVSEINAAQVPAVDENAVSAALEVASFSWSGTRWIEDTNGVINAKGV